MHSRFNLIFLLVSILEFSSARILYSVFSSDGVEGYIIFEQSSPASDTYITVNLTGLANLPLAWHIHEFPVADGCGSSSVGGHFNPLNDPTCDEDDDWGGCEIGDLSGKHGTFTDESVSETFIDSTVSLYGEYSIVGRSLVIHKSTGSRWVCADIKSNSSKTVVATFDNVLQGTITLTQNADEMWNETTVLIDLSYVDDTLSSVKHNYHVHVDAVDYFTEDCSSTGGHYNPFEVDGTSCSTSFSDWDECEIGDLSGKHGNLSIPSTGANKIMYVDTNLPLYGQYSVAGRSIVVHGAHHASARLDCATLGYQVAAVFDSMGVSGYILFSQATEGENTTITVELTGLDYSSNPWHVHKFPIESDCSAASVGGHYNPFNVPLTYSNCYDDYSVCEVGDLSGKFGKFDSENVSAVYIDDTLNLFGQYSVNGRSIVIHKDNGDRWICADIGYPANVTTVTATFNNTLQGTITIKQIENDFESDAFILLDLQYADGTTSTTSNSYYINEDSLSVEGTCIDDESYFDPFSRSVSCSSLSASEWEYCAVGDLSGKHGSISLPSTGSSKIAVTDTFLPLSGDYTVDGLSISVYDSSGSVIDCANLTSSTSTSIDDDENNDDDSAPRNLLSINALIITTALIFTNFIMFF